MLLVSKRRKGLASLIGSLMMFMLIFTVGAGFLITINQEGQSYLVSANSNLSALQAKLSENIAVGLSDGGNKLNFTLTNKGTVTTTVIAYFSTYTDSSGDQLSAYTDLSSIPVTIAPGAEFPFQIRACTSNFDLGTCQPTSGQLECVIIAGISGKAQSCSVTIFTKRGNSFLGSFPSSTLPSGFSIAAFDLLLNNPNFRGNLSNLASGVQANSSGSVSPLINSLTFYCTQTACEDKSGGSAVQGYFGSAMPGGSTTVAFQVAVSNHDPFKRNITLSPQSSVLPVCLSGSGTGCSGVQWYISGNLTEGTSGTSSNFANVQAYNPNPAQDPSTGSYNTKSTLYCSVHGVAKTCTIPYGKTALLSFGLKGPCVDQFNVVVPASYSCPATPENKNINTGNLVSLFVMLSGNYSGSLPFTQTIPYAGTYTTSVQITSMSGTAARCTSTCDPGDWFVVKGGTVTLTVSSGWNANTPLTVYWVNQTNGIGGTRSVNSTITVGKSQSPFPDCSGGCTIAFKVPNTSPWVPLPGKTQTWEIEVTDGTNVAYDTVIVSG